MAGRVNVKFIAIAGAALTVVGGAGLWYAYDRLTKTAEESVQLGDEAAAQQDWETAVAMYSRAVNKDQGQIEWIEKWIDALRHTTPETTQLYNERYQREYLPALRARAEAERDSVAPFRQYLDEVHTRATLFGRSLGAIEGHLTHVSEFVARYRGDETAGRVLRRYPGIARGWLLRLKSDLPSELVRETREDLEAALAADPADEESTIALSTLDMVIAEDHRKSGEAPQAAEMETKAKERLTKFVETHPPATAARLSLLQYELMEMARTADKAVPRIEAFRARRDKIQQLVDAALGERKDRLLPTTTVAVAELAEFGLEGGGNMADMLYTQALQGRPNDPHLLFSWGVLELIRNNSEKAVERFQKLVDLPNPPISLTGTFLQNYRGQAVAKQIDAMLVAWESATTPEDRSKFETKTKEYRARLNSYMLPEDPTLLSIDARVKYMEGDISAARKLLSDYNDQTLSKDPQSVLILAEILLRQGSVGAARTNYERVLELDPRNLRALMRLASIAMQEQEYETSSRYYEAALRLKPDDDSLKESHRIVSELALGAGARDPVMKLVNEVHPLTMGVAPDLAGATAKIRDGLRLHPGDARLSAMLAELLFKQNDKAGAIDVVKSGLAVNPDHPGLRRLEAALNDPDPTNSRLQAIDQSTLPDYMKHLERYKVLLGAGRKDEANAELDAAAKLNGTDPLIVEVLFMRAATREDLAELDRLCQLAEVNNLDQARGLVYRSRRDLIRLSKEPNQEARRGGMETVAAGLRTALGQDKLNPALWRMLGVVQMDLGQHRAAAESLTRALQIKPNDVVSHIALVKAHMASSDMEQALRAAREGEQFAAREPEFAKLLLALESEAPGGDRVKALAARQRLAQTNPDDMENKLAIVSLLLMANRVDEAEPLTSEIAAKNARLGAAARAAILAKRGDRDGAVAAYTSYLATVSDPAMIVTEYSVAARFLGQIAGSEQAIALLAAARDKQGPKREFDRLIADMQYSTGQWDKAVQSYQAVLGAGVEDTDHRVLKNVIDAHLRQGKFREAEELLAGAGPAAKSDPYMLIMGAQAAAGQGNNDAARRLLDQAVAAAPENYYVYFKRAEFTSTDASLSRDTEADLEQSLKLKPEFTAARRFLATLYFSSGRTEQGIEQIRRALAATPSDTQLRMEFVELLIALQRVPDALGILEDAVRTFSDDVEWKYRASLVFSQAGRFERAAELLGAVFAKHPTPEVAEVYVAALARGPSSGLTRAMQVLQLPQLNTNENWRLILMRAFVLSRAREASRAREDIVQAWEKIDQSRPEDIEGFFNVLRLILESPQERLQVLAMIERKAPLTGWALYRALLVRLESPELRAQAESALMTLAERGTDDTRLVAIAWTTIGANAYQAKNFELALNAFQRALALSPNSAELNNNVAFTLGIDLQRPNEALPYAETASRLAPSSSMILDTLGAIYHRLGRNDDALPVLERAVNFAVSPSERVPALLHYASALYAIGQPARARQFASTAEQFIAANPAMKDYYEPKLKELLQTLDGE